MIKDPERRNERCRLYYHDIGDYLTRGEKLNIIEGFGAFGGLAGMMQEIVPNEAGDWIRQRSVIYEEFMNLGNKKEQDRTAVFEDRYSGGVKTNRDAWCYNFSREALKRNMKAMIDTYNYERERWHSEGREGKIDDFVTRDQHKISWSRGLYECALRNREITFDERAVRTSLYRPFVKSNLYFDRYLNEMVLLSPALFPTPTSKNRVICVSGVGSKKPFSVLMTDIMPCYDLADKGQNFPLYWYEELYSPDDVQGSIFSRSSVPAERRFARREAISDYALSLFREHYHDTVITKADIFSYIYGVLSSPEYAERFGDDVKKMLARVPYASDFRAFCEAV